MPGANMHSELAIARRLHRPQSIRKFRARAGECEGANDVGADDVMLLRTQKHQMAAVVREVACIRRLILAVDLTIGVELGLELRRRRVTDRAKLLFFVFDVKSDRSSLTCQEL